MARTLFKHQELDDFYPLNQCQGPSVTVKERKQQYDVPLALQVSPAQGVTMKDHLSLLSTCTGIDFNLVRSVSPQTCALPANTAQLEQIFAHDRCQGTRDNPL